MKITVNRRLLVESIPPPLHRQLVETLTLPNPQWVEKQRMGRWLGGTEPTLRCYESAGCDGLYIPRGFIRQLIQLSRRHAVPFKIFDHRLRLPPVDFCFTGRLKPFQQSAVSKMHQKEFGTLAAVTGAGKTVMALKLAALRRQPTLVVVHTKDLAMQWVERIEQFLGIPADAVGMFGDGRRHLGRCISVGLVQTLYRCAEEICPHIGHLIVDECHRIPSRTFTEAVTHFNTRFMLGLSATPWRRDGLSKLIFWHLGDTRHRIDKAPLVHSGDLIDARVVIRETGFKPYFDPVNEYSKMLTELVSDDERNRLIAADVASEVDKSRGSCLVLTNRKAHCETLRALLKYKHAVCAEMLTGDCSSEQRREALSKINQGQTQVLIATGQLIGEGLDCRALATLFLATPVKFSGRVLQYLGRILRPAPGKKKAKVYDYVDIQVGPLQAAARSRQRVYRAAALSTDSAD